MTNKLTLKDNCRRILNKELLIWQKAYPKQKELLDKYTNKILFEILIGLKDEDKKWKIQKINY